MQVGTSVAYSNSFSFERENSVRVSSASAGTTSVGAKTFVWGTARGAANAPVWTEVKLPNGRWSKSQQGTTNAQGGYAIPLTYNMNKAGTTTYRVGVKVGSATVYGSAFSYERR